MRANLKKHGGDMKAAADAYKQSGGHYARAGGDATAAEKAKYKHGHAGMNPAVGESNVYEKRASPKKKKTGAKEPAKGAPLKTKYAKADESIFDTLDDTKAKATAKEAAAAATPKKKAKRRTPAPAPPVKAKRGMTDAQKKKGAKDRLKAGGYTNSWFKYRDGAFAADIFDTKTISTNYRRVAELKKRDDYDAQNARDDREMVESESAEANAVATAPVKAALKKAGRLFRVVADDVGDRLAEDPDFGQAGAQGADDDDGEGEGFGAVRRAYRGHQLSVTCVALADDEATAWSGSKDCSVLLS